MKKILTLAALILSITSISAQKLDLMKNIEPDAKTRIGTLDNGIKYYIRSNDKDKDRANFHIVYNVGAVQETDEQQGLAHFLEHMAFNGSKNFPENTMIDYLRSIGVAFGENLNAGTGQELTTYMITQVPITREGIIDSTLMVIHDWAGFISLNGDDIDNERGVILEEKRTRNTADFRVRQAHAPAIYGAESIYTLRDIIGPESVLKNFSHQEIRDFYKKWYRPDLQAFIIVGDFDLDMMEAKLKKTMADIKEHENKAPIKKNIVKDNDTTRISIATDPEYTGSNVTYMIRHKAFNEKYRSTVLAAKMDMISNILSTVTAERFKEITMQNNAPFLGAYGGFFSYNKAFDALYFSANSKEGELQKAFNALYTEMLRLEKGGITMGEFDRAKIQILTSAENDFKANEDRKNQSYVNTYLHNFIGNSPMPDAKTELELTENLLENITLNEVNTTFREYMQDKNNVITFSSIEKEGLAIPTEKEIREAINTIDNTDIEIKKEDAVMRPLIDKEVIGSKVKSKTEGLFESTLWTLGNGIKIYVKPTTLKANQVLLDGSQKGGKTLISDANEYHGADIYSAMQNITGVADFSTIELNKILTGKTAKASLNIGNTMQFINGESSTNDIETMLQLIYLRYTQPRYNADAINTLKEQLSAQIKAQMANPMLKAVNDLYKTLYNNDPKAGFPTVEDAEKLNVDLYKKLHDKFFTSANGMEFTIVGDFNPKTLQPLVEKYLGALPVGNKTPEYGPNFLKYTKGVKDIEIVRAMEIPKVSAFRVYTGDINEDFQTKITLDVLQYVLNIRYTKAIREEAGGTYGVGVQLNMKYEPKPEFITLINFDTDVSKIKELMPIVQKEIDEIIKNGPNPEDVNKATENFVKKFSEKNNNNSTWVNYIIYKAITDRDQYTNYIDLVENVTPEMVQKLASEMYTQGNEITLIQVPE